MPRNGLGPAIACSAVCGLLSGTYGYLNLERPPIVDVGTLVVPLIAALAWVQLDARAHGVGLVHDWGLIAWIGWPVLLPWYSFKTRGRAGWRLLLLLLALILGPFLAYPFGMVARAIWPPTSTGELPVQEVLRAPLFGGTCPGARLHARVCREQPPRRTACLASVGV